MMKSINCFFVFTLLLLSNMNAQTISSKVVDKISNQPLEYATVAIKNTGKGVITNQNGNFRLTIIDTNNSIVVISYLGYKTVELRGNKIPSIIHLEKDTKTLQAIIVSAETPISILKKAYQLIEKNYPQKPTKQILFYRESNLTAQKEYMYVSEGVLEVVKSKYNRASKNDLGQVKILKSRTNYLSNIDFASNANFYGGHFSWNTYNFVQKRMPFINPKHFEDYYFELLETSIYNGKLVYIITFDNQDNQLKGQWNGTLYIDKESYAYIGADVKKNTLGIKKTNRKRGNQEGRSKESSFNTRYIKIDKLWYFNSCIYKARITHEHFEQDILFDDKFVVTETITEDVKPIDFEDRLTFSVDFSKVTLNNFDDTFFDTYTTLEENEALKQQIEPVKTTSDKNKLSKKDSIQLKTNTTVYKIINKFSLSIGLTALPISIKSGDYRFKSLNNALEFIPNEDFRGINRVIGFYGNLNFDLSKRWTIGIGQFYSLNRFIQHDFYDINLRYSFLLKKIGKPLILQPQIAYWFGKTGLRLENANTASSEILMIGERNFETDQLRLSMGKRLSAIKSSLNFNYQLSVFGWLQAGIDFYVPISEQSRVFVWDGASNSFPNTSKYPLENNDFVIEKNGQLLNDDFPLDIGEWSFRLGVFIHF